jgi:LEA14-like dessication related protein
MLKVLFGFILLGLFLLPASGFASSVYSSGEIDDDLQFQDFKIGENGYLTGVIVNTSKRTRLAVKLDVWTTNTQETQIYWRKTLDLGDMAPGAKISVKEPYKVDREDLSKTKFMFRIPRSANFRNK